MYEYVSNKQREKFEKEFDITSGKYYSFVMTKGRKYIPVLYKSITVEINTRKFPTMTKLSYAHIPEYYTIPINRPFIDAGPSAGNPYGRWSKNTRPKWANEDQTPELLLEPFQDDRYRSVSTMADMIDMHQKKIPFEIIDDWDIIYIYRKLQSFIDDNRNINLPKEAEDYIAYLNKIIDFLADLKRLYLRSCRRKKIYYTEGGLLQFIINAGLKA